MHMCMYNQRTWFIVHIIITSQLHLVMWSGTQNLHFWGTSSVSDKRVWWINNHKKGHMTCVVGLCFHRSWWIRMCEGIRVEYLEVEIFDLLQTNHCESISQGLLWNPSLNNHPWHFLIQKRVSRDGSSGDFSESSRDTIVWRVFLKITWRSLFGIFFVSASELCQNCCRKQCSVRTGFPTCVQTSVKIREYQNQISSTIFVYWACREDSQKKAAILVSSKFICCVVAGVHSTLSYVEREGFRSSVLCTSWLVSDPMSLTRDWRRTCSVDGFGILYRIENECMRVCFLCCLWLYGTYTPLTWSSLRLNFKSSSTKLSVWIPRHTLQDVIGLSSSCASWTCGIVKYNLPKNVICHFDVLARPRARVSEKERFVHAWGIVRTCSSIWTSGHWLYSCSHSQIGRRQ